MPFTPLEEEQSLIIHDLQMRLEEAEEVLAAIRRGEVDALVVKPGMRPQIWSLNGVDHVYRVLFETLNEGAVTVSAEGTILYSNSQFAGLVGRRLQKVVGAAFTDLIAPADTDVFDMLLKRGLQRASKGELRLGRPDGTTVPVMVSFNAVEIEQIGRTCTVVVSDLTELKRVQSALAAARDDLEDRVQERTAELRAEIGERARLEVELEKRAAELEEADRRKTEFLAMLGHELRNPLAPVTHAVEVIRLRTEGNREVDHAREVLERQMRHLARLVDDLLDVSRITRGMVELRREGIELRAAVESAAGACRASIEAAGQSLHLSLPTDPCWMDGDVTRLEQVVTNLLSNATKYTPAGGTIHVTLERHGGWAELTVRDTGRGIPGEKLPHVFDLFTQVDAPIDRSLGGLGIGLTVVRSLVELHGGSVHASSDGPGLGSEFLVRLPLLAARASGPLRPADRGDGQARHLRVLLVEDNLDAAETLGELMEIWGHDVHVVHQGQAGVEGARTIRPDVILLDIGLPGMDGFEVARRIRDEPDLARTPLFALTGYGQEADRRRSHDAGFDEHLTKPVNPMQLQRLLAGIADRRLQRREGS
jgi:PAS domain S-box-containing protein